MANSNYYAPPPQPIDPAVFFDLVKIRRLIDEATSLAVRAANGTTASSLNSVSEYSSNVYASRHDAELLGIVYNKGSDVHAKLSRERKHRMRTLATEKLAHAYRLDEIAASVVTMQAASALEDVAMLVLDREEDDPNAKYVHFFHEKIPSRSLATSTTLDALNSVVRQIPTEASTYRTRAVTRIYKDDYSGAIKDLSDGLAVHRLYHAGHQNDQRDIILAKDAARTARIGHEPQVEEKDHPSSIEAQFYFHRGNTHLAVACNNIKNALNGPPPRDSTAATTNGDHQDSHEKEQARIRVEARKIVRTYAKRALRDFMSFLSKLDYTPGLAAEYTEAFLQRINSMTKDRNNRTRSQKLLDVDEYAHGAQSGALVKYTSHDRPDTPLPELPPLKVYKLNELFAPVPPPDLPPFPPSTDPTSKLHSSFSLPEYSEAVTYHPLLIETLHSILLCHSLIQTSPKEHLRHAHMAARLIQACDAAPIFLAARSPARSDWMELIRRSGHFPSLENRWEGLCDPASAAARRDQQSAETVEQRRERIKQSAIEGALGDERVVDEETFQLSVRAREALAEQEDENAQRRLAATVVGTTNGNGQIAAAAKTSNGTGNSATESSQRPSSQSNKRQNNAADATISSDRAQAIYMWMRDAPPPSAAAGDGSGRSRKKKSAAQRGRGRNVPSSHGTSVDGDGDGEADGVAGLERSVESLEVD
jgi:hypothetical protein